MSAAATAPDFTHASLAAPADFIQAANAKRDTAAPRAAGSSRLGIVRDAARRAGLRVVRVTEIERLEGFCASVVRETRNPTARHYLQWSRVAATPAAAREKIRAMMPRPLSAPSFSDRSFKVAGMTKTRKAA